MKWLSKLVDNASNYFAHRKGLLPLIGIVLVILNYILPFLIGLNVVTQSNLFLHLGVIVAILGRRPEEIATDEYLQTALRAGFVPRMEELNPQYVPSWWRPQPVPA